MEAVRELLTQLRTHALDAGAVQRLCLELEPLLFKRVDLCTVAGDCGAVEFVTKLLQAHAGHAGVQVAANRVLFCLCIIPAHARAAAAAGAIEAVIAAMRGHAEDADVQRSAGFALHNLIRSQV
jgi:hypothetical protein